MAPKVLQSLFHLPKLNSSPLTHQEKHVFLAKKVFPFERKTLKLPQTLPTSNARYRAAACGLTFASSLSRRAFKASCTCYRLAQLSDGFGLFECDLEKSSFRAFLLSRASFFFSCHQVGHEVHSARICFV